MSNLPQFIKQIEQLSPKSQAQLGQYIDFLQWQESQDKATPAGAGWSFGFIETFKEANIYASEDPAGMDVKLAPATVGGESRPAVWAHPPVAGQAVIEYHVPVPQQVSDVKLRLAIGLRDGAKIAAGNLVAFTIKVNGIRAWGQQSNQLTWQEFEIPVQVITGDMVRFEFSTEALGSHEWTWAVWGDLELVGWLQS